MLGMQAISMIIINLFLFLYLRGAYDKFPDFFCMGI